MILTTDAASWRTKCVIYANGGADGATADYITEQTMKSFELTSGGVTASRLSAWP